MSKDTDREGPGPALKVAIAGALMIGAVASGYFVSRQGRNVLKEAIAGRRRTRLEDRVLEALWGDPVLGHRTFDVEEKEAGTVILSGMVRSEDERQKALALAGGARDVRSVEDRLVIQARRARHRFLTGRSV